MVYRPAADVATVLLKPVGEQGALAHAARSRNDKVAVIAGHEAVERVVGLVIAYVGRQAAAQKGPLAAALAHQLGLRLIGEVRVEDAEKCRLYFGSQLLGRGIAVDGVAPVVADALFQKREFFGIVARRGVAALPDVKERVDLVGIAQHAVLYLDFGNAPAVEHVALKPRVAFEKPAVLADLLGGEAASVAIAHKAEEEWTGVDDFVETRLDDTARACHIVGYAPAQVERHDSDIALRGHGRQSRKYAFDKHVAFGAHVGKRR